ncbi:MAG: nucleoside monophosphate kinase [Dehalogenimonas sp.]
MNEPQLTDKGEPLGLPTAILIMGPTGSGKTPLGDLLETRGIHGRRTRHFDFGSILRNYTASPSGILTKEELAVVRNSLASGALLEDRHFSIAEKLLAEFIRDDLNPGAEIIVMNGLPRHTGQSAALSKLINIKAIVVLDSTSEVIFERIARDTGGDRCKRTDDGLDHISRRLQIFRDRTLPLLDYYERTGRTKLIHLTVGITTTAEDAFKELNEQLADL